MFGYISLMAGLGLSSAGDAIASPAQAERLVVVDRDVLQTDSLIKTNSQVLVLDKNRPFLPQLLEATQSSPSLKSIEILSHASSGALELASGRYDADALERDKLWLAELGKNLPQGTDLKLYGCDLAAGEQGQDFVERLARYTGLDVAASSDVTASLRNGGNWQLEYQVGDIATDSGLLSSGMDTYAYTLSHFRGGGITWQAKALDDDGLVNDVEVTLKTAWRYGGGSTPTPREESGVLSFTLVSSEITYIDDDDNNAKYELRTQVFESRNLDLNTAFKVNYASGNRIGELVNNANGSWDIQTVINLEDGNLAPQVELPIIFEVPQLNQDGSVLTDWTYDSAAVDPNGDKLRFRLATLEELGGGSSTNPAGLSIHPNTGVITWTGSGAMSTGLYSGGIVAEDLDENSIVKSKTHVDFIFYLQNKKSVGFELVGAIPNTRNVTVEKGKSFTFDIQGSSINSTSLGTVNGALTESSSQQDRYTFAPGAVGEGLSPGSYPITFEISDSTGTDSKSYQVINFIVPDPEAPLILNVEGDTSTYSTEFYQLVDVASNAQVTDNNDTHLKGGYLRLNVNFTDGDYENLSISSQGDGAGEIRLTGSNLYYQGDLFAELDADEDGVGKALIIHFVSEKATLEAVSALIQRLVYTDTFTLRAVGERQLSIYIQDGAGKNSANTLFINVEDHPDKPAGGDPVLVNNTLTIQQGETLTLSAESMRFADPDTQDASLTISVSGLKHAEFYRSGSATPVTSFTQEDVNQGLISIVHDNTTSAPEYQLSVSDGTKQVGPFTPEIRFLRTGNVAPTISGSPQTQVFVNKDYLFVPQASDLDGDTFTFSIENRPSWASFDSVTGTLSGRPELEDADDYTGIVISVTDSQGAKTSLDAFVITVAKDSDLDGVSDDDEIFAGTDPNDRRDYPDADGDGVPDNVELQQGSDPNDGTSFQSGADSDVAQYFWDYPLSLTCSNQDYISQLDILYRLQTSSSPYVFEALGGAAEKINAMGFNVQDGYLYAIEYGTSTLYRMEASGLRRKLGDISGLPLPASNYYVADFDHQGNFYVANANKLYRIDIETLTAETLPMSGWFSAADMAYHIQSNAFYGVRGNRLYKIDLSTLDTLGKAKITNTVAADLPQYQVFGGAWFDSAGRLFVIANDTGNIYRIDDIESPSASFVSKGPVTRDNDSASCSGAPSFTHTISVQTAEAFSEVEHTYVIYNGMHEDSEVAAPLVTDFNDLLADGRTFVADSLVVSGAADEVQYNLYGDSNQLTIENIQVPALGKVTIAVKVFVPAGIEKGIYYNQAVLSGIPDYLVGVGDNGNLLSDSPGGAFPDETPLTVIDASIDNQIQGQVFNDFNKNQVQDEGEPGVPGIAVTLGDGTRVYTDSQGEYRFIQLTNGEYKVNLTATSPYSLLGESEHELSLSGGETGQADYALYGASVVTGLLFVDLNGNGIQEPTESVLAGQTLSLLKSSGEEPVSLTVDEFGRFYQDGLTPGAYWLSADIEGYTTSLANPMVLNLSSAGMLTQNLGVIPHGSISGVVFSDVNGNGRQDPLESGLAGVNLVLSGDADMTATTDAQGAYQFTVPAGQYIVTQQNLDGYLSITQDVKVVSLNAAGAAVFNFGDQQRGHVSGWVFEDANGNGIQDIDELGVSDIALELSPGYQTTTALTGEYDFSDVDASSYSLNLTLPEGYAAISDLPAALSVTPGGSAAKDVAIAQVGSIIGTAFSDINGDGVRNASEQGLAGIVIIAKGDNTSSSTLTKADGSYEFHQLLAGEYQLSAAEASGFVSTTGLAQDILLTGNNHSVTHFGYQATGTIGGVVFNDLNGNGVQDSDEQGLAGVTIALSNGQQVVTSGNGSYLFVALTAGDYQIVETDPEGFYSEQANTVDVTLAADESKVVSFADKPEGVIFGRVVNDIQGDQALNGEDAGLAGVEVVLSGAQAGQAITDSHGTFVFAGLIDGGYQLTTTDLEGYLSVSANEQNVTLTIGGSESVWFWDQLAIAPVAAADSYSLLEGGLLSVNAESGVLNNDSDTNLDALLVSLVEDVANGQLILSSDGSFSYQHFGDEVFSDSFSYRVFDGNEYSQTVRVNLSITPQNDAPVATPDTAATQEDVSVVVPVLDNDSDVDSASFTIVETSSASGSVSVNDKGELVFVPNAHFNGAAAIDYCISDGNLRACSQLIVTVTAVNDAPVASPDFVDGVEDVQLVIPVLNNDTDLDGDSLNVISATSEFGQVSINDDGSLSFEPNENIHDTALINYCISDSELEACAQVQVDLAAVNDTPIVGADTHSMQEDETADISVLNNDIDPDGDALSLISAESDQGSVSIQGEQLRFTPNADFNGQALIAYCVSDTELQACGQVNVSVTPVNDAPVALDDIVQLENLEPLALPILDNDIDADGDTLNLVFVSATTGSIEVIEQQAWYTPEQGFTGNAVVRYQIQDAEGEASQALVLVKYPQNTMGNNPIITPPDDVFENANALFTKIDLGVATATDRFGNTLPVSLVDGITFFEPGINTAYWEAVDSEGNRSVASQLVRVKPLISMAKDQTVLEGGKVTVKVLLNGLSPVYPLEIKYTVSGDADSLDHNATNGSLLIEQGTEASFSFDTYQDAVNEGEETVVITLDDSLNLGNKTQQRIAITEGNVAPELTLDVSQGESRRLTVSQAEGEVVVASQVYDPDATQFFDYQWQSDALVDQDMSQDTFSFDPQSVTPGVYYLSLKVTDSGVPALDNQTGVYIQVVESLSRLSDQDSDGDLIPDNQEGFADSDGDGIADYLDAIDECNVLPEQVAMSDGYLVEGDPGVCLRRGNYTFGGASGGAQLMDQDITQDGDDLVADTQVQNTGGVFDYIAYGLPDIGQIYQVVMPQRQAIPEQAVYRKFSPQTGWVDFVEDSENFISSTAGEPGYCPPPGGDVWQPGLNKGHWCVQLSIKDGGANDADGIANGVVVDPGGVGIRVTDNQLPLAVDDSVVAYLNQSLTFDALANDSDPDGDSLTLLNASVAIGEVEIQDNQLVYTPPSGQIGEARIAYSIADEKGATDSAEVVVTIRENQPPVALDDALQLVTGTQGQINVLANDTDPENEVLTVSKVQSEDAEVSIENDGVLAVSAPANFTGDINVTYWIEDTYGHQASATLVITVLPQAVTVETKGGGSLGYWYLLCLLGLAIRRSK